MATINLFIFFFVATLATVTTSNGVENFVRLKLSEYPEWIKSNSLDPSAPVTDPTSVKASNLFATLDIYLSNHGIQGHSEDLSINSVTADLQKGEISMSFTSTGNIKFSGRYLASGTLLTKTPITGEGSWDIQVPEILFQNFKMNFLISGNGQLYITSFNFNGITLPTFQKEIYFQNLLENDDSIEGYHEVIENAVYLAFQEYLIKSSDHPLKKNLMQYFQEIFSNTPLKDILATPKPEATSTVVPPTTSKVPLSTTPSDDPPPASSNAHKIELPKTTAIFIFTWIAAMTFVMVMILCMVTIFIRQSRRSEKMLFLEQNQQHFPKL